MNQVALSESADKIEKGGNTAIFISNLGTLTDERIIDLENM